jgi:acetolactate synthase-1/2/3 large subunit
MKAADAVAKILKLEGVEYLSCFPHNGLIDSAANVGIRTILTRSERVAVHMADGYARVTNGRCGIVCAVQSSAGIENSFSGVAQAFADSAPILIVPQGVARRRASVSPSFEAVPHYRGITKWAAQINFPDRVPERLRRAFTALRSGRPGPVMLEMPSDVEKEELDDSAFQYSPVKPIRTAPDPDDVQAAARALVAAKLPLFYAGQGILYAQAWDELRELAELLQAPVMTTMTGKSAFPEHHPLSIGLGANTVTKAGAHFLNKADLVFGAGTSLSKVAISVPIPPGKTVVHLTNDVGDINKEYAADFAMVGDAQLALSQLIEEVKLLIGPQGRTADGAVASEIEAIKAAWITEWMPKFTSEEVPINPYRVIWDLMQTVDPKQAIVIHDSGYPRDALAPFYVATTPRGYIGWGHTTPLGASLGFAMGAKLAAPEKLVINVIGDGGFGMVGTDFETAVRERIPILTVLLNNSALGSYDQYLPISCERYGMKNLSGQYAKMAEALGGYGEKVESPADVLTALRRGIESVEAGQPALLEMITCEEKAVSRY